MAEVEQPQAREAPHGPVSDVGYLRKLDPEFFEEAKVLVNWTQRYLWLRSKNFFLLLSMLWQTKLKRLSLLSILCLYNKSDTMISGF